MAGRLHQAATKVDGLHGSDNDNGLDKAMPMLQARLGSGETSAMMATPIQGRLELMIGTFQIVRDKADGNPRADLPNADTASSASGLANRPTTPSSPALNRRSSIYLHNDKCPDRLPERKSSQGRRDGRVATSTPARQPGEPAQAHCPRRVTWHSRGPPCRSRLGPPDNEVSGPAARATDSNPWSSGFCDGPPVA